MSKAPKSKETCRHVSMNVGCRHCEIYTYKLQIGPNEIEVNTGLFTCRDPESGHYTHVFTGDHPMPCVKSRISSKV